MLLLLEAGNGYGSAATAAAAAILAIFTRPQTAIGFGALYVAAILLVDPAPKSSLMQIVRAAGLTAMAVVGIAAILPLGTLIDQIKEYIAILGQRTRSISPLSISNWNSEIRMAVACVRGHLAFILFFRLGGKPVSNRLTVLVCIVAPIISAVILARTISRLDEFRIGPATGTLAFCALSLACLRKDAAPADRFAGVAALIPWIATMGASAAVRPQLAYYSGISSFIAVVEFSLLYVRMWLRSPWRHAPDYTDVFRHTVRIGIAISPCGACRHAGRPNANGVGARTKTRQQNQRVHNETSERLEAGRILSGRRGHDLSGNLPGAVFAIGGLMPVFPWISAGYPFSYYFRARVLKRLGQARLARSGYYGGNAEYIFKTGVGVTRG